MANKIKNKWVKTFLKNRNKWIFSWPNEEKYVETITNPRSRACRSRGWFGVSSSLAAAALLCQARKTL